MQELPARESRLALVLDEHPSPQSAFDRQQPQPIVAPPCPTQSSTERCSKTSIDLLSLPFHLLAPSLPLTSSERARYKSDKSLKRAAAWRSGEASPPRPPHPPNPGPAPPQQPIFNARPRTWMHHPPGS